jgi:hypothetical protein
MARFSGVIGIQINLMYRERPVIWSVELEYYRVVTAITPVRGRTNRDENEEQNERSNYSPDLDRRAEDGGPVF